MPQSTSFALLVLLLLPFQVAATYFKYNDDFNCTYPVTVVVDSMTCNEGQPYCTFGDEMTVSGSMTLEETLPAAVMCVTSKTCFMGFSWLCKRYKEEMNVCNAVGLSGDYDGTPCPNAGFFYFGSTVELPATQFYTLGSGWWVDVQVTVEDCNPYKEYTFTCHGTFSAVSVDDMINSAVISGVGVLGLIGLGVYVARKRQQQNLQASINLSHEEQQLAAGADASSVFGFEMMKDTGVRV